MVHSGYGLSIFVHVLRLALSVVSSVDAFVRNMKLFTLKQVLCWFFLYVSEEAKHVRGVWLVVICPRLHYQGLTSNIFSSR